MAEEVPSPLLADFAANPADSCFALQASIIRSRAERTRSCGHNKRLLVADRTVCEDLNVFVELHKRNGWLTQPEVDALLSIAAEYGETATIKDVLISMTAEKSILRGRLSRALAPAVIVNTLDVQVQLYRTWLENKVLAPLRLVVDTSTTTKIDIANMARWVLETVEDAHRGKATPLSPLGSNWVFHGGM